MRVPNTLVRNVFEPLWDQYERSIRLQSLRELRDSQFLPTVEILARRDAKLKRIVEHAAMTSPFYRERFELAGMEPSRVRSIDDLHDLPVLTKDDVRENLDRLISSHYSRDELVSARTGGSTGVSLQVYCDEACRQQRNAAAIRSDEWSGWRLGEPMGAVWGNPPVARTLRSRLRSFLKDRIIYLDTMKLNGAVIDRFLEDWARLRPGLLFGHAHSLFLLAEDLLDRGLELRPNGVVSSSMMLLDLERKVIEQAFGVPVTNRYGCEEVSLIACECEQHRGLHINSDHNVVEFLREDGTPCRPGENGRIVVTELINYGMPMIRYEVGDWGVLSDRLCPCGRGLPLMESLTGRTADFLVAQDGSRVAGISLIERTQTLIPGIRQMQLVQEELGLVQVNLVRDASYGEASECALVANLREALGEATEVRLNFVERIAQEINGKYRYSVCKLR